MDVSLKVGEALKAHGGRDVPKHLIAADLGMDEESSGFYSIIASAKTFGIVDGTRDMSLTEGGRRYFFSGDELNRRLAVLGFMVSPPKYRLLVDKYDGSVLPSSTMLATVLGRLGVPASWTTRAASLFISQVQELGIIDDANCLRYRSTVHKLERSVPATATQVNAEIDPRQVPVTEQPRMWQHTTTLPAQATASDDQKSNVWTYTEAGGTVKVITPDPFPKALWSRLSKYVEMLKPEADETQGDVK